MKFTFLVLFFLGISFLAASVGDGLELYTLGAMLMLLIVNLISTFFMDERTFLDGLDLKVVRKIRRRKTDKNVQYDYGNINKTDFEIY